MFQPAKRIVGRYDVSFGSTVGTHWNSSGLPKGLAAADIFDMTQKVHDAAKSAGVASIGGKTPKSARILAACGMIAFCFTVPAAEAIGLPPAPLTSEYKDKLRRAFLEARKHDVQMMHSYRVHGHT